MKSLMIYAAVFCAVLCAIMALSVGVQSFAAWRLVTPDQWTPDGREAWIVLSLSVTCGLTGVAAMYRECV